MKKVDKKEYNGYGILAEYTFKINKLFANLARYFFNISHKFKFEQFKIIFGEREDDIYISTYPKSGTTLMQMILYHLTTDGRMNFKHIYEVSPWIHNASFIGQKPPDLTSPRIIKTHDNYKEFGKKTKGRFIYVYRNGMDVAISNYHQQKNYNNSDLKLDKYLNIFFKQKKWFKHTREWMINKNKLSILYIKYEDLLKNKTKEIDRIISFLGISRDKKAINRALKYSSFEYMKKNENLFGEQRKVSEKIFNQFIRKGKSGEGKSHFTKEQKDMFMLYYKQMVENIEEKTFGQKLN
tara:strand:- start:126 stop:1010 length:885 start_codon:yes stop_codon:yes gene_type:complete